MVVLLIEFFLQERHLRSTGTFESVRLREVFVLWDVHLKRFHCMFFINPFSPRVSVLLPTSSL